MSKPSEVLAVAIEAIAATNREVIRLREVLQRIATALEPDKAQSDMVGWAYGQATEALRGGAAVRSPSDA